MLLSCMYSVRTSDMMDKLIINRSKCDEAQVAVVKFALVIKYSGYCHTWTDCSKVTKQVSNIYDMSCSLLLLDTVLN